MTLLHPFSLVAIFAIGTFTHLAADDAPSAAAEADLQFSCFSSSTLASEGGRVSRSSSMADVSIPLFESTWVGLEVDLSAEKQVFRFSNFSAFIAGKAAPLSRSYDVGLQPSFLLIPKGPWSVVISPKLEYSGSEYIRLKDSRLWSLSTAVFYQSPTKLKIGLGVNVSQRLNASALILPFPVIDWQLSERWNLSALDGESGRLSYRASPQVNFYGELRFNSRDIRLARTSSIPGGVLRTEEFPLLFGTEYRLSKHALLRFALGKALGDSLRFEDGRGQLLGRSAVHSPVLGTISVDLTF